MPKTKQTETSTRELTHVLPAAAGVPAGAARCARRPPGPVPGHRRILSHALDHRDRWQPRRAALPRKEVIQPQLPLRLPCYDFVPITSPTLGVCAPEGFAHRLQVLPAFMT